MRSFSFLLKSRSGSVLEVVIQEQHKVIPAHLGLMRGGEALPYAATGAWAFVFQVPMSLMSP